MDAHTTIYYAAWLVGLLVAIAGLSAAITHRKRRHDSRRQQATALLGALHGYGEWVTAQRLAAVPQGDPPQSPELAEARRQSSGFPELDTELAALFAVHERLLAFLRAQQVLWRHDPGHWLAADHDRQFMALWRLHRAALQPLDAKLQAVATVRRRGGPGPGRSTYA